MSVSQHTAQAHKFHIKEDYSYFEQEQDNNWYRNNQVTKRVIDKVTGNEIASYVVTKNRAKVLYDSKFIDKKYIKDYLDKHL